MQLALSRSFSAFAVSFVGIGSCTFTLVYVSSPLIFNCFCNRALFGLSSLSVRLDGFSESIPFYPLESEGSALVISELSAV